MVPIELPTFEATWWPLQMETIPGSGEAITVAVLARAASGQSQIRQSVAPAALTAMFGHGAGKGMQTMVGSTVIELQRQLDNGVPPAALEPPFGGFQFGHARDGVARDLNEVFDIAVRLSAAFGQSGFGRHQEVSDSSRIAFNDWADRVQLELVEHDRKIAWQTEHFQVKVKLANKRVQFGVLRGPYAANLGVLRPGHTSGDSRSLKAKVFDLEALRRDQVMTVQRVEMLVGCPPYQALGAFTRREVDGYHQTLEFIEHEARQRQVPLITCQDAAAAARHIETQIAA